MTYAAHQASLCVSLEQPALALKLCRALLDNEDGASGKAALSRARAIRGAMLRAHMQFGCIEEASALLAVMVRPVLLAFAFAFAFALLYSAPPSRCFAFASTRFHFSRRAPPSSLQESASPAPQDDAALRLHAGLVLFGRDMFHDALVEFLRAMEICAREAPGTGAAPPATAAAVPPAAKDLFSAAAPDQTTALSAALDSTTSLGREDIEMSAVNNVAICALHCCDVPKAISALEELIRRRPEAGLQPLVLFNLCTLYDVAYHDRGSQYKKDAIKAVSEMFHRDWYDSKAVYRLSA